MKPLLKLPYYSRPVILIEKKACIRWIEVVFKDCLSDLNDEISFSFGIVSLICWAVAEIPQIITNFNNKSASGVSLAFLSTWIIGDVFNLVGCILEPATLPTQFYTAVLYTTLTAILGLQSIYYNRFSQWYWKGNKYEVNSDGDGTDDPLEPKLLDRRRSTKNVPVEVPQRRDFYFMSARSLAGSDTPTNQSYMKARSGPPVLDHQINSSSDEDEEEKDDNNDKSFIQKKPAITQPRIIPRPIGSYGTFAAVSANLPHLSRGFRISHGATLSGIVLFQEKELHENTYGQWLGWLMAAIYMGGRIPQIWLNAKRGSVEGLNPLMFAFALVGNATYVASILVRTTEWRRIKANMPWLLDAMVCVALDLFIILQYIFYKYLKPKKIMHCEHHYGSYVEADKLITP